MHPSKILEALEKDQQLGKYFKVEKEKMIWDNKKIARVIDILGPYIRNPEISVFGMKKRDLRNSKYARIKLELSKRNRRRSEETINKLIDRENKNTRIEGKRHKRNSKLALLMKELFDFTCEACQRKEDKDVIIEVSHKIPLYFGYKMGGVDKSWYMEVLCHPCHMTYEKDFSEKIFKNPNLKSKKTLRQFLRDKYLENFEEQRDIFLRSRSKKQ